MMKLFLIMWSLLNGGYSLGNMSLTASGVGSSASGVLLLCCNYNLECAELKMIRWFRGDEEMYRVAPRSTPRFNVSPRILPPYQIDLAGSNERELRLVRLNPASAAKYTCEVTATVRRCSQQMFTARALNVSSTAGLYVDEPTVSELPELRVHEIGRDERGVLYRAWCRVPPSYPRATVRWLLGGAVIGETQAAQHLAHNGARGGALAALELRVQPDCCTGPEPLGGSRWTTPLGGTKRLRQEEDSDFGRAPIAFGPHPPLQQYLITSPPCAGTLLSCRARLLPAWEGASRVVRLPTAPLAPLVPPPKCDGPSHAERRLRQVLRARCSSASSRRLTQPPSTLSPNLLD